MVHCAFTNILGYLINRLRYFPWNLFHYPAPHPHISLYLSTEKEKIHTLDPGLIELGSEDQLDKLDQKDYLPDISVDYNLESSVHFIVIQIFHFQNILFI